MNENIHYSPRLLEESVKRYLKAFPVVAVTGPRQSGKSTLLLHLLKKDYTYVTFDDFQMVDRYHSDPVQFMNTYSDRVIFDEVQKVPEIFSHIKLLVDQDRSNYGRFVLTGSCQFAFLKSISESLAGRIGLLTLLPFQFSELPKRARGEALYRGSYPELVNREYRYAREWYSSYLDSYLDKDVPLNYKVGDMRNFRRFVSLLAANAGSLFNASRFANDLGVAVNTIKRWLSILEASYIIFILPPFFANHGKRLIKSPKVYFYDTGLLAYLMRMTTREMLEEGPFSGQLFENYIVGEMLKKQHHWEHDVKYFFYRTSHGVEIDLIAEFPEHREMIEIKSSETFRSKMTVEVEKFLQKNDRGYLVYRGETLSPKGGVEILNYQSFLSLDHTLL
ncbi:MAG: hypothetical protein S4CHLAM45_10320 [Chlamydiales bacterium]|nr:hypothetical protein [Chlamydiales bacterium]MCH9619526.1 hypothetical protein [Chlamydiales bacterium]MCH9623132.1 hypothetical protein [Chlamydiales bacterium]